MSLAGRLGRLRKHATRVGLLAALRIRAIWKPDPARAATGAGACEPQPLRIKGYPDPVWIRRHSSDVCVLEQIFINREYGALPAGAVGPGGLVIDCGANVGYASLFFLREYPGARVVAVEPDPGNFRVCERNLGPYRDRVRLLRSAVWPREAALVLRRDPGEATEWGVRVEEAPEGEAGDLTGVSLDRLIDESGAPHVDLLKVDIEGAEAALFAGRPGWVGRVKNLAIELHNEACERSFFDALAGYDYELSRSGELTVCTNIRRRPMAP